MTDTITIAVDDDFGRYAVTILRRLTGLRLEPGAPGDVRIGGRRIQSKPWMPRVDGYSEHTIPDVPTARDVEAVSRPGASFPFDIVRALRFWLADEGHADIAPELRDDHDRLIRANSVQGRKWSQPIPIVNAYGLLLRRWLEVQFKTQAKKNRCRVALTHDVDDPVNPGDIGQSVWIMGAAALAGKPRAFLGQVRGLPRTIRARLTKADTQHWNFDQIVESESKRGFQSAFYFAATTWWMRGASNRDVTYDVRSPKFRTLFKTLRESGAEVGLHMSYNVHLDEDLLVAEKNRLERANGRAISGGRHHYWRLGHPMWKTLEGHSAAALRYDTSVGFNEAPGYRLGIGSAFYPWNPETAAPMKTLQIPTLIMDGSLLYRESVDVDAALEQVDTLLKDLKRFEGTVAIDWHVRTSYPGRTEYVRWAKVYEGLLDRLASDSDIDVMTPETICAGFTSS